MRNGSATPRKEGFAKQTLITPLEGWSVNDVASRPIEIGVKLEALLRRYPWKKVPQTVRFRTDLMPGGGTGVADRIAEPCSESYMLALYLRFLHSNLYG